MRRVRWLPALGHDLEAKHAASGRPLALCRKADVDLPGCARPGPAGRIEPHEQGLRRVRFERDPGELMALALVKQKDRTPVDLLHLLEHALALGPIEALLLQPALEAFGLFDCPLLGERL